MSGWASGPSTVIWVRPGLERQGLDRPRARSFQRQGGTWGRWRLRRGCKASQWGGDKGRRGSRGEPRPHLSWERAVGERGRNRPPERGPVKKPCQIHPGEASGQSWSWACLCSASQAGPPEKPGPPFGPPRARPGVGTRAWPAPRGPGRGPRDLPVARPPLAASPPAPEGQRRWSRGTPRGCGPRDGASGPPARPLPQLLTTPRPVPTGLPEGEARGLRLRPSCPQDRFVGLRP